MRSTLGVMVALGLGVLGLDACGGGGGGGAPSVLPATSGVTSSATSTAVATAAPSGNAGTTSVSGGTVNVSAVDYFTNQPIIGATVNLDGAPTTLTGSAAILSPTSGLHTLTVTANGYATYNGGLQAGGATTRVIQLFPVSTLMQQWIAQINADRAVDGRPAVQLDDMLTIAAYDHAVDMGTRNYFAHMDTHGFAPTTRSLLLGSMMMAAENIAAGYSSWSATETAFVNEKQLLPNKSAADCATDTTGVADHYCNIIYTSHTHVGLAAASVGGSKYGTYYDQEFGDFYGRYDTSLVANAANGSALDVLLQAAGGASFQAQAVATLPLPVPISVATLNADPTCASQCPAADQFYPQSPMAVAGTDDVKLTASASQLSFIAQYTSTTAFTGAGSWALVWPNPTALPDVYAVAADSIKSQSTDRGVESTGVIAPNPHGVNRAI